MSNRLDQLRHWRPQFSLRRLAAAVLLVASSVSLWRWTIIVAVWEPWRWIAVRSLAVGLVAAGVGTLVGGYRVGVLIGIIFAVTSVALGARTMLNAF